MPKTNADFAPREIVGGAAPSPDRITELGYAFRGSKVLLSAVELGLFTVLADGPLDLDRFVARLAIAPRGARDFFDSLVALGLLDRDHQGRYHNTPESDHYLDRRKQSYIGGELEHFNRRVYPAWTLLTSALKTGNPQGVAGNANGPFASMYADDNSRENFSHGMTGGSLLPARVLAATFPWREHKTLVDVGTAQGCLPVQIALAHPHLIGGGFDLPQMRTDFESYVQAHGLSDRLSFHAGDFFTDALPCADVLVFGRILHNWDLATKMMLLRKAHDALPSGGAVIVYERLIDDQRRTNAPALLASLNMLIASAGGFDFSGADCIGWLREVGFCDMRVEPLAAGHSAIIGMKRL
jgi:hypothetical protein